MLAPPPVQETLQLHRPHPAAVALRVAPNRAMPSYYVRAYLLDFLRLQGLHSS